MPGDYVVSAVYRAPMTGMPNMPGNAQDANEGFAPTFYPGTASEAQAQIVTVGAGEEIQASFALQSMRLSTVSGTVTTSQGRPAEGGMVMLRNTQGMIGAMSGGQLGPDGSFTLNVTPGQHYIDVRLNPRGPGSAPEFGSLSITVDGSSLNGVAIRTGRGAAVSGHVTFEGSAPRTGGMGPTRVFASQTSPGGMGGFGGRPDDGTISDDGDFHMRGVSGRVLFRVQTPPSWTVKSIVLSGDDITDTPIELASGDDISGLQIVLTDRLTELSGAVKDSQRRAVTDYVVIVFPSTPRTDISQARFVRSARPDQQGRFQLRGLPPGDYYAAALESLEQGREWDPGTQSMLRNVAQRITLREGQATTADLNLVVAP